MGQEVTIPTSSRQGGKRKIGSARLPSPSLKKPVRHDDIDSISILPSSEDEMEGNDEVEEETPSSKTMGQELTSSLPTQELGGTIREVWLNISSNCGVNLRITKN